MGPEELAVIFSPRFVRTCTNFGQSLVANKIARAQADMARWEREEKEKRAAIARAENARRMQEKEDMANQALIARNAELQERCDTLYGHLVTRNNDKMALLDKVKAAEAKAVEIQREYETLQMITSAYKTASEAALYSCSAAILKAQEKGQTLKLDTKLISHRYSSAPALFQQTLNAPGISGPERGTEMNLYEYIWTSLFVVSALDQAAKASDDNTVAEDSPIIEAIYRAVRVSNPLEFLNTPPEFESAPQSPAASTTSWPN